MLAYILAFLLAFASIATALPVVGGGSLSTAVEPFGSSIAQDLYTVNEFGQTVGTSSSSLVTPTNSTFGVGPSCVKRREKEKLEPVKPLDCYSALALMEEGLKMAEFIGDKFICPSNAPGSDVYTLPVDKQAGACLLTLMIEPGPKKDNSRCLPLDIAQIHQAFDAVIHSCIDDTWRGGRYFFGKQKIAQVIAWQVPGEKENGPLSSFPINGSIINNEGQTAAPVETY